jgi:hypothetical protein
VKREHQPNNEPLPNEEWDGAAALFGTWPDSDALVPQLELAERLDYYVGELAPWLEEQPGEEARECYLDLMVGLCTSAEAMRALVRGDLADCVDHMESAVRHLEQVTPANIVIPDWRTFD